MDLKSKSEDRKAASAEKSKKVVALIDSDKFGQDSTVTTLEISQIDVLITDNKAPEELLEKIKAKGVEVMVV